MSTLRDIVQAYNNFDLDKDGTKEIETIQFLPFENPDAIIAPGAPLVIVFVEQRLLMSILGVPLWPLNLLERLKVFKQDLLTEGFSTAFLAMNVYSGPIHQDGMTLLAIREFLRDVRENFGGLKGAILVGNFPEATIVRSWSDWRTLTKLEEVKELGKMFPAGTEVWGVGKGFHAGRSEIVLADLGGRWLDLYQKVHPAITGCTFVPFLTQATSDGTKVQLCCFTGNYSIDSQSFEDVFWIKDDEWQAINTPYGIEVLYSLKMSDPELEQADKTQPNSIARPDICVSRINAKHIAISPDASLLDQNGKPKRCSSPSVFADVLHWKPDPRLERSLLIEYFDRNHAFRTGCYSDKELCVSRIEYNLGLGSVDGGLGGIGVSSNTWEAVTNASLVDVIKWLKKPATIRGIAAHADHASTFFNHIPDYASIEEEAGGHPWRWVIQGNDYAPSFEGHVTADINLYRTLWENKLLQSVPPSFVLHCGCEVNTPWQVMSKPYNNPEYGIAQNAESILFYTKALGVMSRAKSFWDGPGGFGNGFGASEKAVLGDGWMKYFQMEALNSNQTRVDRKKSSMWSLLGDWTLRKYYFIEVKTCHFNLRYVNPNESASHTDQTIQFAGKTVGHCYANGNTDILKNSQVLNIGKLPTGTPLYVKKIAVWLEYFYHLLGNDPYCLGYVQSHRRAEVTIGKVIPAKILANSMGEIGFELPNDQDISGTCLKALLDLEHSQTGKWPDWIFPAIIRRVAVSQVSSTAIPDGFANFHKSLKACEWTTVYDAQWIDTDNWPRTLQMNVNKPLKPKMSTVVFLDFENKMMRDGSVQMTMTSQTPNGETSTVERMGLAPDCSYYYGAFRTPDPGSNSYVIKLKFQGIRSWQDNILKSLIGDQIDSNPFTAARVQESDPLLTFSGIELGMDEKHQLEIGTLASFAPVASLSPDQVDQVKSNNSFATACRVDLILSSTPYKVGVTQKVEKVFNGLNFHDAQDVDYFHVAYQCPAWDDADRANRQSSVSTNSYWGLKFTHLPPRLICSVSSPDLHCIDVDIYKYNTANPVLFKSYPQAMDCIIESPIKKLGRKECYLVIKNHNFAVQGVFPYELKISYLSSFDDLEVDLNAPGYDAIITRDRKYLDKLYDRIDKPRPPEYRDERIQVDDITTFIMQYEKLLLDTETVVDKASRKTNKRAVADGLYFLGQIAETCGQYGRSEYLYRKSAKMFTAAGDKVRAAATRKSLESLCKKLKKTATRKSVKK